MESDYVALIYEVSELVASGSPAWEVIEPVRGALVDLLHLRSCRYEDGPSPRPAMRLDHDAQVVLGGRLWNVDRMGLPGPRSSSSSSIGARPWAVSSSRPLPATKCRSSLASSPSPWPTRWVHRCVLSCAARRPNRLDHAALLAQVVCSGRGEQHDNEGEVGHDDRTA